MPIETRNKRIHANQHWLCGVTVAYLTFNQAGVGSSPSGATVQDALPCAGTLCLFIIFREETHEHIWKTCSGA